MAMPRRTRFSAVSRPTNPAPMTTAVRGLAADSGQTFGVLDGAQHADPVEAG